MLQLKDVCKSYTTANFTQVALNHVSLAFRDNEFVAILGPSGSGKTTMLNIIGGLDHYDSGDLLIDGISTKQYRDRDWDTYRNNRIGFVFQAYNLIPHQTILENGISPHAFGRISCGATRASMRGARAGRPSRAYQQKAKPTFWRPNAARRHCARPGQRA